MIVLKNATLVHLHPAEVTPGVDIVIDGTEIHAVGRGAGDAVKAERTIDLAGRLVMPGLVCSHDHFYSGLSRGIMARIAPSTDFVSTLQNLWWRLDASIDEKILTSSGMVCALEAVKAGCTAVVDHHASPGFISGSVAKLKGCFEKVGLRGILCYEATDRNGEKGLQLGIEENRDFARLVEDEKKTLGKKRLVEAMIGGHAPFTLSDQGLAGLADVVKETARGFHVHVAEDGFDPSFSHRMYGKDPLRRLDDFGLVTEKSLVGHGLYLSPEDREILNLEPHDRLGAELRVCDDLGLFDRLRNERAGASDRCKIDGRVLLYRVPYLGPALAFPDHAFEPVLEKIWRILVHAIARGRAGSADRPAWTGWCRPRVIEYLALQVERKGVALFMPIDHVLVRHVPAGVDHPGDEHPVSGLELRDDLVGQGWCYFYGRAHNAIPSLTADEHR